MELMYKDGWEQTKKRLDALWRGELIDRCCISVTAPLDKDDPYIEKVPSNPKELEQYYLDETWILERNLNRLSKSYFGGDALPCVFPYFGTGGHAKYLSSEVIYRPDTIWLSSTIQEYSGFDFSFDPEKNEVFQREKEIIHFLAEEGKGKFFVSPPDNCGSLDALAQLRGNSELLMDFYDQPEEITKAVKHLVRILKESNEFIFRDIYENNDHGCVHGWMNTWSSGPQMQLQCDASVMLSADMFKEFVVPELTETCESLEHAIYHMDGMEQLRHLDLVLDIPGISMIQWVQVAGQPPVTSFLPQLKKMQEKGKGLVLIVKKSQLPCLLSELSPKGLNLIVEDAQSKEEAEEIVKYVTNYRYRSEQIK